MRQDRTVQTSLFDVFAKHEIGGELKRMSEWLDEHPTLLGLVAADLRRDGVQETGRHGLPAEAVLRSALLKQYRQLSYEELAFHLSISRTPRRFGPSPDCRGLGARRSRCCTRRSARSEPRPGRRSIGRCWRALGRRSWRTAASCGWTARSRQR